MSMTNDWDAIFAFSQRFLQPLCRFLFKVGLLPRHLRGIDPASKSMVAIHVLPRQTTLSIDTVNDNILQLDMAFYGLVGESSQALKVAGTALIGIDVTGIAVNSVLWPDYLSLDGTDHTCAECGELPGTFSSDAGTIELWVKTGTSNSSGQFLLCVLPSDGGSCQPCLVLGPRNRVQVWLGAALLASSTDPLPADGLWHHLAVVMDGGEVTFYRDGQAKNTVAADQFVSQTRVWIGGVPITHSSNEPFNGWVTQLRIWDVARTGSQIQQAMNAVLSSSEDHLLGYWTFSNGNITNTVTDSTGTLCGNASIVNDGGTSAWTRYLNFLIDGASLINTPIVTLSQGDENAANAVSDVLSAYFIQQASRAFLLGQPRSFSYPIPTLTNFLTYGNPGNPSAGQFFSLMMTENSQQPSTPGDFSSTMNEGSCLLLALSEKTFFTLVLEILTFAGFEYAAYFSVSGNNPATLSLNEGESIVLYTSEEEGAVVTGISLRSLTVSFTENSLSANLQLEMDYIFDGETYGYYADITSTLSAEIADSGKGIAISAFANWAAIDINVAFTAIGGWDVSSGKLIFGVSDSSVMVALQQWVIDALNAFWVAALGLLPLGGAVMGVLGYPVKHRVKDAINDFLERIQATLEQALTSFPSIGEEVVFAGYASVSQVTLDNGFLVAFEADPAQPVFESSTKMSDLDDALNDKLKYFPATGIIGLGLDYGNDKNRVGLLLKRDRGGVTQILAKAFSSSGNLASLAEAVNDWLEDNPGTILDLALKKSNQEWKALLFYNSSEADGTYKAGSAEEETRSDEQDNIQAALSEVANVAAFGFSYGSSNYGAMWIYT